MNKYFPPPKKKTLYIKIKYDILPSIFLAHIDLISYFISIGNFLDLIL